MKGNRSHGDSDFHTGAPVPPLPRLRGTAAAVQPLQLDFSPHRSQGVDSQTYAEHATTYSGTVGIAPRLLNSAINHEGLVAYSWHYKYVTTAK